MSVPRYRSDTGFYTCVSSDWYTWMFTIGGRAVCCTHHTHDIVYASAECSVLLLFAFCNDCVCVIFVTHPLPHTQSQFTYYRTLEIRTHRHIRRPAELFCDTQLTYLYMLVFSVSDSNGLIKQYRLGVRTPLKMGDTPVSIFICAFIRTPADCLFPSVVTFFSTTQTIITSHYNRFSRIRTFTC